MLFSRIFFEILAIKVNFILNGLFDNLNFSNLQKKSMI